MALVQLICNSFFAYTKSRISCDMTHVIIFYTAVSESFKVIFTMIVISVKCHSWYHTVMILSGENFCDQNSVSDNGDNLQSKNLLLIVFGLSLSTPLPPVWSFLSFLYFLVEYRIDFRKCKEWLVRFCSSANVISRFYEDGLRTAEEIK